MKRICQWLIACTVIEALPLIRPGAQWVVHGSTLTWLDAVQSTPTLAEIQIGITQCQAQVTQIQNDILTLNTSTGTITDKFPALIDLLQKRGVLQ